MITIFFAYSHADEALRLELEKHLSVLRRNGEISAWHDRRISPGEEWRKRIDNQLETAQIILLLVSPDFLNSDYCYDIEMARALERHQQKSATVVPIILRPCDWQHSPLGELQALPPDGKAVSLQRDQDLAFLSIIEELRRLIPTRAPKGPGAAPSVPSPTDSVAPPPQPAARSSNLRLRRDFTARDLHRYRDETFEYIRRYFEESLRELTTRYEDIEGEVQPIDALQFSAVLYRRGSEVAACRIALHKDRSAFIEGITYSSGGSLGGYQEQLSVKDDGYTMFLQALMGSWAAPNTRDQQLTQEGAAELLWSRFIEPLQTTR